MAQSQIHSRPMFGFLAFSGRSTAAAYKRSVRPRRHCCVSQMDIFLFTRLKAVSSTPWFAVVVAICPFIIETGEFYSMFALTILWE